MPVSKLLNLPYGSYLMVRLDFKIICGDELEAKIMRIIEMYMDDERRLLYKELLNDPRNEIDPNATVEITKDVWPAISHRLFKNDLYDPEMSENTLKRAIKSLLKKKFIKARDDRTKRYEAPKYQLNIGEIQKELDSLSKIGKTEYQKLMGSKFDGIKNSSHQIMTPGDHQILTPSGDSMVSNFDPNSRKVTDSVEERVEDHTNDSATAPSESPTLENTSYVPETPSEKSEQSTQQATTKRASSRGTRARSEKQARPRKPRSAKTTEKPAVVITPEAETYLPLFEKWLQEATEDTEAGYLANDDDKTELLNLLKKNAEKPNYVTPEKMRLVLLELWKQPRDERSGFSWQDNMTLKNVCKQYPKVAIALAAKAREKQMQAKKQEAKSNRGVSGLGKWIAPGSTQAAITL